MTFDECVSWLMTMLEVPLNQADVNFTRIIPAMLLYAEGRIYGDLTFLSSTVTQEAQLTALRREFLLPTSVVILEQINVCTPAGPITYTSKRATLERVSPVALDMFWPQESFKPGLPQKYALIGSTPLATLQNPLALVPPPALPEPPPQVFSYAVRLMPTPDRAYHVELTGVVRPNTLSQTNKETFLSTRYPELLLCACMVFGSGYQRDFGAQADDPQRAMSWEGQYKALLQNAMVDSGRIRGEGPAFTTQPPAIVAQLPRAP